MIRIAHVLDATATWETRIALQQLYDRLSPDQFSQAWFTIDALPASFHSGFERPVARCPRRLGLAWSAAPALGKALRSYGAQAAHAWGVDAASAVRSASEVPLLVTLFDPEAASRGASLLRALDQDRAIGVVCAAEIIRRKLVERGLRSDAGAVVRPGVDFARLNAARRGGLRGKLGLEPRDYVVSLPPPPTREGGHFDAAFAAVLLGETMSGVRVVIAGASRERDRIARFVRRLPARAAPVFVGDEVPWEQLIAVSDALVVAHRGDPSTTAVAWAMAAGAAVIGAAGYAVAELIANKLNGLLFKRPAGRSPLVAIAKLLRDRETQARVREVARGHAYEVFGVRRFIDQQVQAYRNLAAGRRVGEGIADAARVG